LGKVHRHIPSRGAGPLAKAPQDRATAQAYQLRSAKKYVEAKPLFKKLYEAAPQDFALALDYGEICMETEDFTAAVHVYAKILEAEPKHLMALTNLGGALIRAGKLDDARAMLEYALELDPKNIHARINLGGILQAAGDRKGNLDNALEAVSIEPSSSLAFNNLGSAFSDMAMFAEAKHAYETAVMLDPKQVDALVNLAAVEARLGNPASSAEKYEQVLKLLPASAKHRADAVRFYASFEYLKQGILEKGWEYYEGGFSPLVPVNGARSPNRKFSVPRWDGELLNGKTLLVWREQGLGDELLFATCLHELAALGGEIIVECDARLVETFTRSFPAYRIRAEAFLPQAGNISPNNDFDLHVPMGSLMKYFRRDKQSFTRSGAYVVAHSAYVEDFRQRLAPYQANTRLVGICWRSGKLDPVRNLGYTTIDEWAPLLQMPGYTFVNLQYGDCESELQAIEQKLNIKILRWPDLNLKNDLDRVFALMHNLDAVVSVQTAVLTMAGSVGVPVVGVKAGGWTALGQQKKSLWFDSVSIEQNIAAATNVLPDATIEGSIQKLLPGFSGLNVNARLNDGHGNDVGTYQDLLLHIPRDHDNYLIVAHRMLNRGALLPEGANQLLEICMAKGNPGIQEATRLVELAYKLLLNGYCVAAEKLSTLMTAIADSLPPASKKDLAVILAGHGQLTRARDLISRAYQEDPQLCNGYSELAEALVDQNQFEVALNLFREDLHQNRVSEAQHVHSLVYICGLLGQPEFAVEAVNSYRKSTKGTSLFNPFFTFSTGLWHAGGFNNFPSEVAEIDTELQIATLDGAFVKSFDLRQQGLTVESSIAIQQSSYRGLGLFSLIWIDVCRADQSESKNITNLLSQWRKNYYHIHPFFRAHAGDFQLAQQEVSHLYRTDRMLNKNMFFIQEKMYMRQRHHSNILGVGSENFLSDSSRKRLRYFWMYDYFREMSNNQWEKI
jgi:tetratricopeptide (TPR) repeat protein